MPIPQSIEMCEKLVCIAYTVMNDYYNKHPDGDYLVIPNVKELNFSPQLRAFTELCAHQFLRKKIVIAFDARQPQPLQTGQPASWLWHYEDILMIYIDKEYLKSQGIVNQVDLRRLYIRLVLHEIGHMLHFNDILNKSKQEPALPAQEAEAWVGGMLMLAIDIARLVYNVTNQGGGSFKVHDDVWKYL